MKTMARSLTHQMLVDAVQDQHRRLDDHPAFRVLVSRHCTLNDYLNALELLHRCFRCTESAVLAHEHDRGGQPDAGLEPYVPRLPAIEHDLHLFSDRQRMKANGTRQQTDRSEPPMLSPLDRGGYLGARYVLDGSALGGTYIARSLARSMPELSRWPLKFWPQQEKRAAVWPALLSSLQKLDDHPAEQQQARAAASHTFAIFLSRIEQSK